MKKQKKTKNKIITMAMATIIPLSTAGLVCTIAPNHIANASSVSNKYSTGQIKTVSMSNGSFNSSSSTYTLSTSLTGWTGQLNDKRTTAGIINTGNNFQQYMSDTYHLANNPLAKGSDKHILMVNSKTANSKPQETSKQGYKSSSINLDANSYYSFQVSFKNDTNYNSYTDYIERGNKIEEGDFSIEGSTFNANGKGFDIEKPSYISFSYKSLKNIYLQKALTLNESLKITNIIEDVQFFYEDDNFVGFIHEDTNTPIYISKQYVKEIEDESNNKIFNIEPDDSTGISTFTCSLRYNPSTKKYDVPINTPIYTTTTAYTSLNDFTFGSVYLDGLKDEDGKPVEAQFLKVSSKEWVTFYFFVATGNEAQSVNFNLWLGTKTIGSSGVAFFDDCQISQYSENEFWKAYQNFYDKNYIQNSQDGTLQPQNCTQLVDLRTNKNLSFPEHNFNFEKDISENKTSLKNWTLSGNGNGQVFDTKSPQYFKSRTGYDYVGSTLTCEVVLNGEKIELLNENKNVLALWTENNTAKVTSENVDIQANEIYKIKAYYKVSELKNGNAYIFVKENDSVIKNTYNLTEEQYTLANEVTSNALSSNSDNELNNKYNTVEFFVKGGAHFNSSINISLGLGKSDETSTGCVLFDNITIEKATTEEFKNATNKIELDTKSGTQSVLNGNFRNVVIENNATAPYNAENWTIENENDAWHFGGIVNTGKEHYNSFFEKYKETAKNTSDRNNPYYWASYTNPKDVNGNEEPNNVMMLANITKTWQTLKSDNFSLNANSIYKLSFNYKTFNSDIDLSKVKVIIRGKDGFKLYESEALTTRNAWGSYEIYFKTLEKGATEASIEIQLGNKDEKIQGFAYFDNFLLTSDVKIPENKDVPVIDMTNYYLNLPTNNIPNKLNEINADATPGYKGTRLSGENDISGGIVKSEAFTENSQFYIENETDKNVFFINIQGKGSYSLQSNFAIDLEADKYYTLTFKLKTHFNDKNLDKDKKYNYGVTAGLTGFKYMTELKSNDAYETFTIHFKPKEATSSNLYIALVCDTDETMGAVAIYDLEFQDSTEDEYNAAKTIIENGNYSLNKDKVFIAEKESTDDSETPPDDSDKDDNTENNSAGFDWLYIPTLITALAIVIAIAGYFMRKVKIKKIEIKRKESYDRKTSLNVDLIKEKANKERTNEANEIKDTIAKFEKELANLETAHKQKVVALRAKDKDAVSKETDKEFKQFAQKRTVIAEKIDSLNKQLEEINSPEHLLNLERKIYAQEEMKKKELERESKKLNKQIAKDNKEKDKKSK